MKVIKKQANNINSNNTNIPNTFIINNFNTYYYKVPYQFLSITVGDTVEINLKCKCNDELSGNQLLVYPKAYETSTNTFELHCNWFDYTINLITPGNSNSETISIPSSFLRENQWVSIKVIFTLTSIDRMDVSVLMKLDTQSSYTNIDNYNYEPYIIFDYIGFKIEAIGNDLYNTTDGYTNYFNGEIDLKETNIKLNNNIVWEGVTNKYYDIKKNNKYYGINDTLNPPSNVIFDEVDSNNYITYKSRDGQTYWRKSYSGLCYGGFCVFEDGGSTWIIAFTISEVQNNCIMYRNGDSRVLEISSGTLNYKGKNWYYSLNGNANNYNSATSTMIDFNKNNGRYWIGGENKIYTGSDNNEKFIQVAKDFLDYIYSF